MIAVAYYYCLCRWLFFVYPDQDNEISREKRRRQRTDKELRDVRSKLDIKTAEHDEVGEQIHSTNSSNNGDVRARHSSSSTQ